MAERIEKKEQNPFNDCLGKLDIVEFIEKKLVLEGKPFLYSKNGRNYVKGLLRYCAHILPYSNKAKPVVVLKGRQTGISSATAGLTMYFMEYEDHKNILHAFPEIGQARRHSSGRLKQLIEDSTKQGGLGNDFQDKKGTDSQSQKDFKNANILYVEGISKDARRIRGMSVDLCCYDEFASTTRQAFDNSLQAAANTSFRYIDNGAVIPHFIFGTPESEGSFFHQVWEKSDKREYLLKCQHCGHYFPIFFDVISKGQFKTNMDTGTIVRCLDRDGKGCQKANDKMGAAMDDGKWSPTKPTSDCKYVGYFIPQYLNGRITREMIVDQFEKMPTREFFNEVLGLFYAFEDDALSKQEIIRLTTTNPNTSEWEFPPYVLDKQTFMGVDWGARVSGVEDTGVGSYTVVTIMSLMPTGHLKLEYAGRLQVFEEEEKVKGIIELIKKFNVNKCVVDYGYGKSNYEKLKQLYGPDRIVACEWGGHRKRPIIFEKEHNIIRADKHVAHEMFFDQVRQQKFCFPYSLKAEAETEWLLDHMTNIEVINVEKDGIIRKEYHKKRGKETDGLASLIYAYTAFQFFKTNGFALGNNQIGTKSGKSGLQPYIVQQGRGRGINSQAPQNYSRSDRRKR